MLFIYSFLVGNELNIAFPFVILMSQNHIQKAVAWYLEQFHMVLRAKH